MSFVIIRVNTVIEVFTFIFIIDVVDEKCVVEVGFN